MPYKFHEVCHPSLFFTLLPWQPCVSSDFEAISSLWECDHVSSSGDYSSECLLLSVSVSGCSYLVGSASLEEMWETSPLEMKGLMSLVQLSLHVTKECYFRIYKMEQLGLSFFYVEQNWWVAHLYLQKTISRSLNRRVDRFQFVPLLWGTTYPALNAILTKGTA